MDSIQKKIRVVQDIKDRTRLKNVTASAQRAETLKEQYDFVISRAVARLAKFLPWIDGKIHCQQKNELENGVLYLKGMSVEEELQELARMKGKMRHSAEKAQIYPLSQHFDEAFFSSKCLVHIPFCK